MTAKVNHVRLSPDPMPIVHLGVYAEPTCWFEDRDLEYICDNTMKFVRIKDKRCKVKQYVYIFRDTGESAWYEGKHSAETEGLPYCEEHHQQILLWQLNNAERVD